MKHWTRAAWCRFVRLGPIGWIVAAVHCGVMALMAAWAVLSLEDIYQTKPVDEFTYLVCLLVAAGCAATAAQSEAGRRRYGWLALIGGLWPGPSARWSRFSWRSAPTTSSGTRR